MMNAVFSRVDVQRRSILKSGIILSVWMAPEVVAVSLPGHAQCSAASMVGAWKITLTGSSTAAFDAWLYTVDSEQNPAYAWQGNLDFYQGMIQFELHIPGTDSLYSVSELNASCTKMNGTYDNRAGICIPGLDPGCPPPHIVSGTWSAVKRQAQKSPAQ